MALAQADAIPQNIRRDEFGIVVNQTFTQGGQEFYRRFTDFWREMPDFERYTLTITERPSRRYGNAVGVLYGQRTVFQGHLPVKVHAIRDLSLDAAQKVHAEIISLSLVTRGQDPDIAGDEF